MRVEHAVRSAQCTVLQNFHTIAWLAHHHGATCTLRLVLFVGISFSDLKKEDLDRIKFSYLRQYRQLIKCILFTVPSTLKLLTATYISERAITR